MVTTFVPSRVCAESAAALDDKRLNAQRREALVILRAALGTYPTGAWRNHPATRMWRGYEGALARYGIAVCREWRGRGFRDGLLPEFVRLATMLPPDPPPWWGDERVHASHRATLVDRDPDHYRVIWPDQEPGPYLWPTDLEEYADA